MEVIASCKTKFMDFMESVCSQFHDIMLITIHVQKLLGAEAAACIYHSTTNSRYVNKLRMIAESAAYQSTLEYYGWNEV